MSRTGGGKGKVEFIFGLFCGFTRLLFDSFAFRLVFGVSVHRRNRFADSYWPGVCLRLIHSRTPQSGLRVFLFCLDLQRLPDRETINSNLISLRQLCRRRRRLGGRGNSDNRMLIEQFYNRFRHSTEWNDNCAIGESLTVPSLTLLRNY